jgi:hypothetical protein
LRKLDRHSVKGHFEITRLSKFENSVVPIMLIYICVCVCVCAFIVMNGHILQEIQGF